VRQRLQRENLRLRTRLSLARLRTEQATQRLLKAQTDREERIPRSIDELRARIAEVYGLPQPTIDVKMLPQHTDEEEA
jgi:hypothetical protein